MLIDNANECLLLGRLIYTWEPESSYNAYGILQPKFLVAESSHSLNTWNWLLPESGMDTEIYEFLA